MRESGCQSISHIACRLNRGWARPFLSGPVEEREGSGGGDSVVIFAAWLGALYDSDEDDLEVHDVGPRGAGDEKSARFLEEGVGAVSYTHLRAHETRHDIVC